MEKKDEQPKKSSDRSELSDDEFEVGEEFHVDVPGNLISAHASPIINNTNILKKDPKIESSEQKQNTENQQNLDNSPTPKAKLAEKPEELKIDTPKENKKEQEEIKKENMSAEIKKDDKKDETVKEEKKSEFKIESVIEKKVPEFKKADSILVDEIKKEESKPSVAEIKVEAKSEDSQIKKEEQKPIVEEIKVEPKSERVEIKKEEQKIEKIPEQKIEEKVKIPEQKIEENAKILDQKVEVKIPEQKIEENVKITDQKIEIKIPDQKIDEKSNISEEKKAEIAKSAESQKIPEQKIAENSTKNLQKEEPANQPPPLKEEKKQDVELVEKSSQKPEEKKLEQVAPSKPEEKILVEPEIKIEIVEQRKDEIKKENLPEKIDGEDAKTEVKKENAQVNEQNIEIADERIEGEDLGAAPIATEQNLGGETNREGKREVRDFSKDAENGLSAERMLFYSNRRHPYDIKNDRMKKYNVCDQAGSHPCFLFCGGAQSVFKRYGIGIVLYFKQVKFLAIMTFIVALFAIPALVLYTMSNPYDTNEVTLYSINRKSLAKTTFGNLGRGGYACTHGNIGETLDLTCLFGTINSLAAFGYGTDATTCSTESSNLRLNPNCTLAAMGREREVVSAFSSCIGKQSCNFTLSYPMVSAVCDVYNPTSTIYISAVCKSTQVNVNINQFSFSKSTIAIVAVICDLIAIAIFAAGVALLRYYERKEVKTMKHNTRYISHYAIEVKELSNIPITDPLSLKEALWLHLEKVLNRSNSSNKTWKIYDIQLALSDTGFLDLLAILKQEKNKLIYLEKTNKSDDTLEDQKHKIKDSELAIIEYKNKADKPYIVKAFVTFNCTDAAQYVKNEYDMNCCSRCCGAGSEHLYLKEKWLNVVGAPAPTDIQWRNLQIGKKERFLRKCATAIMSLIVIVICASMIYVAKVFEQDLSDKYPDRACPERQITSGEAERDFYKGPLKSLGLLPCYCADRIAKFGIDVVNMEFPTKKEKLCSDWLESYGISNGMMLGIVLFVTVANFAIWYILVKIASFERSHSVTDELASGTFKIFISLFVNSAIVIFIVNLNTGINVSDKFPILKGRYSEFTVKWYEVVGTPIMLFTFVTALSTHFMELLKFLLTLLWRCCDRRCSTDIRKTKQVTQDDYEAVYTGPEIDLQVRYACSLNLIFLVLMYSSGMPVLWLCLPVSFTVSFFIDKVLFVRFFKSPPAYNHKLADMAQSLYQYAVIIHLGFGFWMFSNTEIVQYDSDFANTNTVSENVYDYSSIPFLDRAKNPHSVIMVIAFLAMIVFYIVRKVLAGCCCCTCRKEKKVNQTLLDKLSYDDLKNEYAETKIELCSLGNKYPKLASYLEDKLELIGDALKKIFTTFKSDVLDKISSKEIPNDILEAFFYENKEKLLKCTLQGLSSYRLLANPQYAQYKKQWEEFQQTQNLVKK